MTGQRAGDSKGWERTSLRVSQGPPTDEREAMGSLSKREDPPRRRSGAQSPWSPRCPPQTGLSGPLSLKGMGEQQPKEEDAVLLRWSCPFSGYCTVALTSINSLSRLHLEAGALKVWS